MIHYLYYCQIKTLKFGYNFKGFIFLVKNFTRLNFFPFVAVIYFSPIEFRCNKQSVLLQMKNFPWFFMRHNRAIVFLDFSTCLIIIMNFFVNKFELLLCTNSLSL